ncbi:MAG: hypothetical protein RLY12_1262 [Verrucomicrobiota bacterium]
MYHENTRSPNLNRLGAVYGLLWGVVALAVLKSLGGDFLRMTGWYLLGSIPTGILVTRLLAGRLGKTKAWKVWTYGPAALLLGTLIFAACMLVVIAGVEFTRDWRGVLESLRGLRFHDSLILFFWFPFFGFVTIVPIFLAVLNCWDLRRRMNPKAGEQFR